MSGVPGDPVRILGQHHPYVAYFDEIPHPVQTRPLQIRPTPALVAHFFQYLVTLTDAVCSQGLYLLVQAVAADLVVAGDAGVENSSHRTVPVRARHTTHPGARSGPRREPSPACGWCGSGAPPDPARY